MSQNCPLCGYSLDVHSVAVGKPIKPKPDDVTICLNCHVILVFTHDLNLRIPTTDEMIEMESDTDFWAGIVALIHTMRNLPSLN